MEELSAVNAKIMNDKIKGNISRIAKKYIGCTRGGRFKQISHGEMMRLRMQEMSKRLRIGYAER